MADVVTLILRQVSFLPFLDVIVVVMVLISSNEKYFCLIKRLQGFINMPVPINIFLNSHNSTFFSFSNFSATDTFQRNEQIFLLLILQLCIHIFINRLEKQDKVTTSKRRYVLSAIFNLRTKMIFSFSKNIYATRSR